MILFFAALITIRFLHNKNSEYKKQTEISLLKQDSLTAVKQLQDKEIFTLQKKFEKLKAINEELEKQLSKIKSRKKN